jgi:hypothetical protein
MREDNSGAAVRRGVGDDLADRKGGTRLVAVVEGDVDAARCVVDMGDQEPLAVWVLFRKAAGEEIARGCKSIELQREFGTLIPHADLPM